MKVPAAKHVYRWDGEEEEVYFTIQHARATRAELRHGAYRVAVNLGLVPKRFSCECYHCQQDWDCCGRMFPTHARVTRVRRGIRVEVFYARNI